MLIFCCYQLLSLIQNDGLYPASNSIGNIQIHMNEYSLSPYGHWHPYRKLNLFCQSGPCHLILTTLSSSDYRNLFSIADGPPIN
jgi:hypothetical protein